MSGRRILRAWLALVLAVLSLSVVPGPVGAQEPSGPQPHERPTPAQAGEAPLDAQGVRTFLATRDTLLLQGYPTFNAGSWPEMWGGYDVWNPQHGIARGLVYFDISSLPPMQRITQATLKLFLVNGWPQDGTYRPITVYRVNSNWSEGTTWYY